MLNLDLFLKYYLPQVSSNFEKKHTAINTYLFIKYIKIDNKNEQIIDILVLRTTTTILWAGTWAGTPPFHTNLHDNIIMNVSLVNLHKSMCYNPNLPTLGRIPLIVWPAQSNIGFNMETTKQLQEWINAQPNPRQRDMLLFTCNSSSFIFTQWTWPHLAILLLVSVRIKNYQPWMGFS